MSPFEQEMDAWECEILRQELEQERKRADDAVPEINRLKAALHAERKKNRPKPIRKLLIAFCLLSCVWILMLALETTELASFYLTIPVRHAALLASTFIVGLIWERAAFIAKKLTQA